MTTAVPTPASTVPGAGVRVATAGTSRVAGLERRAVVARRRVPTTNLVAAPIALALAAFPSYLPREPISLGVLLALAWLAAHALVGQLIARVRPRAVHGPGWSERTLLLARIAGGLCAIATLAGAVAIQDAMRARIGMAPLGLTDLMTAGATGAVVLGAVAAARAAWRHRGRWWRPATALGLVVALTGAAHPADSAASGAATPQEQVLLQTSPVGAVRAYAGLADEPDIERRADLAAERLVRDGGLSRRHVVLAVPTGSGWVDPKLVSGLEQRFGRDVATVGMQYDDRPSWLAFLLGQADAEAAARSFYRAVRHRIVQLPQHRRPQLHVAGESLGATAGQAIFTGPDGASARSSVCSALWVGTPGGRGVGAPREVLVANADDPIVHARPSMLVKPPGDGRPWLPIVSGVQAAADYLGSLAVPTGSGHRYGPDQANRLRTC